MLSKNQGSILVLVSNLVSLHSCRHNCLVVPLWLFEESGVLLHALLLDGWCSVFGGHGAHHARVSWKFREARKSARAHDLHVIVDHVEFALRICIGGLHAFRPSGRFELCFLHAAKLLRVSCRLNSWSTVYLLALGEALGARDRGRISGGQHERHYRHHEWKHWVSLLIRILLSHYLHLHTPVHPAAFYLDHDVVLVGAFCCLLGDGLVSFVLQLLTEAMHFSLQRVVLLLQFLQPLLFLLQGIALLLLD